MTPEDIKQEFSRHPPDAPLMKAFRAWLLLQRDDTVDAVVAGNKLPHDEHRAAGMLRQAQYALHVFDGVLEEAQKRREVNDRAKH